MDETAFLIQKYSKYFLSLPEVTQNWRHCDQRKKWVCKVARGHRMLRKLAAYSNVL